MTAGFVVVRNSLDLEASRFLYTLVAFSFAAGLLAFATSSPFCVTSRRRLLNGLVASLLVPIMFVIYLVAYEVAVCGIAGHTCST